LPQLERNVVRSRTKHPQELLEDMFQLRHELLVLRTAAAQNREIYARLTTLATRFWPADGRQYIDDLLDQFDRVRNMCDGEKELLQGVVDFYHTRTTTRINVAMERLALLTALVLPVTAVASIYGMNVIVSDRTDVAGLTEALAVMLVLMAGMLIWTRRQGWW
jgi:magnesium transporter